jgi:hypothetical protein
MDSLRGSSSAAKVSNDKEEKPEHFSPIGKPRSNQKAKRNIMLEKFQNYVEEPPRGQYAYIPKPFFCGSLTDPLRL